MNNAPVSISLRGRIMENRIVQNVIRFLLLIVLVIVAIVFQCMNSNYLSLSNIMNVFRSCSTALFISYGIMIIMSCGEIHFGAGSQATLSAAIVGSILEAQIITNNFWVAVVISLIVSALSGLVIAFFVVKLKLPSFLTTLAFSSVYTAIVLRLIHNTTLHSNKWPENYRFFRTAEIGPVPVVFIIAVLVGLLIHYIMERSKTGRKLFAVGANITAAKQVGINVDLVKFGAFAFGCTLIGMGGITQTSIMNNVSQALGDSFMTPAIAAAMLGATFLRPGKYNIPGTFVACLLTYLIESGVTMIGEGTNVTSIIEGCIFIVAVALMATIRSEGLPAVSFK